MQRRRLGVNIDHVATLRQARRCRYPDPVAAAALVQAAGADQVTVHLREDRRHIQDRDVRLLRQTLDVPLNLEMAATADMLKVALDVRPDVVTLVPERREELTTEGGLDVGHHRDALKRFVGELLGGELRVSLFIDPDMEQVRAAHRVGANVVELHTGTYCDATGEAGRRAELQRLVDAARAASKLGMQVAAGHGLTRHNVARLVRIDEIEEYNIGHSLIADAVLVGLDRAVRDLLALLAV